MDSDGALDYLWDLAHRLGAREVTADSEDGETTLDVTAVDRDTALSVLTEALVAPTRPPTEGESRFDTTEAAYAVAGLVAARLNGAGDGNTGTRLLAALGDVPPTDNTSAGSAAQDAVVTLGLANHCGYAALVDEATAHQLAPHARAAVDAVRTDREWMGCWASLEDINRHLDLLTTALNPSH